MACVSEVFFKMSHGVLKGTISALDGWLVFD